MRRRLLRKRINVKSDSCKGCYIYENNIHGCSTSYSSNVTNCPCQNCIVKMICKMGCQDYKDCEKESTTYDDEQL